MKIIDGGLKICVIWVRDVEMDETNSKVGDAKKGSLEDLDRQLVGLLHWTG